MNPRKVKISFRRKRRSHQGTLEVYASVRLDGVKHPRRKHICYIAVNSERTLSTPNRSKIEAKAGALFGRLRLATTIEIDWEDANQKLQRIDEPRQPVDREAARCQIRAWTTAASDAEECTPAFADAPTKPSVLTAEEFFTQVLQMHERIGGELASDGGGFTDWWEDYEAPRLLHAFYRFVKRRHENAEGSTKPFFNRDGYIAYLAKHSNRNAIVDYLRWQDSGRRE